MTTPTDQELEKVARNAAEGWMLQLRQWLGYDIPWSWETSLSESILSALKQVQPTKPLVDSIAVSPQEQQSEETGHVYRKKNTITARQFFHVKTPWPIGVCMKHCLDGDWEHPHVHTIHNNQAVLIHDGDWIIPEPDGEHYYPCKAEIFEANYERVPPPASTPANPPKEGRADAESERKGPVYRANLLGPINPAPMASNNNPPAEEED